MRIACSLVLMIAVLACSIDRTPGSAANGSTHDGSLPPSIDAGDAGHPGDAMPAPPDAGPSGDGGPGMDAGDAGGEPDPCDRSCPSATPVCLRPSGQCVACTADIHCSDAAAPACNGDTRTCVACTQREHCGGETPECDPASNTCVQCDGDDHCSGARPRCEPSSQTCVRCLANDDCGGNQPVCDVGGSYDCVQCMTHTDCAVPAHPQCEDNLCVPCTDDTACEGREGQSVCDLQIGALTEGRCVQCSVTREAPCNGKVCNPETRLCTARPLASKGTCGQCVGDSECIADHRCIALQYQGAPSAGGAYCLKRVAATCVSPYGSTPIFRTSASGAPADSYCGISEQRTTCDAISALITGVTCPSGTDSECDVQGGLCRSVNGVASRCTFACALAQECPEGTTCNAGYCGGI